MRENWSYLCLIRSNSYLDIGGFIGTKIQSLIMVVLHSRMHMKELNDSCKSNITLRSLVYSVEGLMTPFVSFCTLKGGPPKGSM